MSSLDLIVKLQDDLDHLVTNDEHLFGVIMGVMSPDGQFSWMGSSGTLHADGLHNMRPNSPYFMASVTKMYTAACILRLVEKGMVSLDTPVSHWLPMSMLKGLHLYKNKDYGTELTLYHLLTHTSGLADYFQGKPKGRPSIYEQLVAGNDLEWDLDEVIRINKEWLQPAFAPDAVTWYGGKGKALYSDTNYQLLGAVLEKVLEKPLQDVFEELIFWPLGLRNTWLHGSRNATIKPADIYHKNKVLPLNRSMASFGPDGGLVTTAGDSLKFIQAMMEGELFVYRSTFLMMQHWRKIFFPLEYGMGLMRFKLPRALTLFQPAPEFWGHSGASGSFLFRSEDGYYFAGTINQTHSPSRSFKLLIKFHATISRALGA